MNRRHLFKLLGGTAASLVLPTPTVAPATFDPNDPRVAEVIAKLNAIVRRAWEQRLREEYEKS